MRVAEQMAGGGDRKAWEEWRMHIDGDFGKILHLKTTRRRLIISIPKYCRWTHKNPKLLRKDKKWTKSALSEPKVHCQVRHKSELSQGNGRAMDWRVPRRLQKAPSPLSHLDAKHFRPLALSMDVICRPKLIRCKEIVWRHYISNSDGTKGISSSIVTGGLGSYCLIHYRNCRGVMSRRTLETSVNKHCCRRIQVPRTKVVSTI